jgi:hypothetical protein
MWMKPTAFIPNRAVVENALVVPATPGMHAVGPWREDIGRMKRSQSWIIPTVMSPEKGGPVYNQLRANFAYTRRMIQRHPFRWIHDNWDFERQALVNVPEPNLEIRKNQWMHFVDAAYWDGIVGRVFQDFMIYMLGYPALAWLLYAMWWRLKLNDKHNFRKKWRDIRANK